MLDNLKGKKIILASKSPRRQELLKGLDIEFEIRTKDVDEDYPPEINIHLVPEFLAELKANAFIDDLKENEIVITADTIVIHKGDILEKPKNRDEAIAMVARLAHSTHSVLTGVSIISQAKKEVFVDQTEVTFCQLSQAEIEYYIDKYKPYDKAGSYGVQEWIGYIAIDKLQGSYFNVMGLPLHLVYQKLKGF